MRIRLTPPNWPTSFRPASRFQNCWLIERVERNWPIGFCVKTDTREDKGIRIDLVIYSLVRSAAKERKKQKIGKSCQNWSSPMSFFVHFLFGSFTPLQSWPIFLGFALCVCVSVGRRRPLETGRFDFIFGADTSRQERTLRARSYKGIYVEKEHQQQQTIIPSSIFFFFKRIFFFFQ